jgi:hypothetical protein
MTGGEVSSVERNASRLAVKVVIRLILVQRRDSKCEE